MDFRKHAAEGLGRKFGDFVKAAGGVIDGFAGGIIHRKPEVHTRALCRGGQAIPASDDAEPHAFVDAVRRLRQQVLVKQLQDRMDLGSGTLPIRGGKREKRQCVNAEAGRGFNDSPGSFGPGAMAGGARQTPRSGPAAIAVRDDGYV